MIRPIVHDPLFLGMPSEEAVAGDEHIGRDLADTLKANREACVGMAANMIGIRKRVIIANAGIMDIIMYNPVIIGKDEPFEAEEGCLSLPGVRKTTRYRKITVRYCDHRFKTHEQAFSGWTAQIIQHEIDHCNGILI